ncbi:MAG: hypothetical protein IKA90_00565, partial [Clostridia bacterium]|nr:hypothetical protein [Clostridia bacterium]
MKKEKQGMWHSVKRFLPYFKPYKKIFVFDLMCVFVATIIELAFPQIVRIVTNDAMNTGGIDLDLMTVVVLALIGMR